MRGDPGPYHQSYRGHLSTMRLYETLCFLLGVIAAASATLTFIKWGEGDVAVMALYSADYYNKVSGEDVIYGLVENRTEYGADENSNFHHLSFPIQETVCQKSDGMPSDDCALKEGGVVKSCASHFFVEGDRDIVVVNCHSQEGQREHSRVRRSRGSRDGGRGRGGRGGRGRGRSGSRSSIASGGSKGNRGGTRLA
ncbi:cathelin-related peptide SC5-like [Mantella aurantiaca]